MKTLLDDPVQERLLQVEELICSQLDGARSRLGCSLYPLVTAGGKRIRPRLALLTGGMLGAEGERLVSMAAAVEMLHTATLVHDDLIDDSWLRRGLATLNTRYPASLVVLVGDFAFARAARLAAEAGCIRVTRLFAETLTTLVDGELAQASRTRGLSNREEYFGWIHAKTASMFELASAAAALLSPVGEDVVASARRFGYELGMAFQIVDDILDFSGDEEVMGKPKGSDLRQGILTLPALCYLESHPEDADLLALIERKKLEPPGLDRLVAAIRRNGAIHQAMDEAQGFLQRALAILARLPDTPERQALAALADQIVHRER